MPTAAEIAAQAAGAILVVGTLWSAMLTVVVPRAVRPRITRSHFQLMRLVTRLVYRVVRSPQRRDRFDSRIAPFALLTLSFVWAGHIIVGFALMYWGQGVRNFGEAILVSGSSLTTLGVRQTESAVSETLIVIEALIGLGLVGLVISYLPTVYGAYLDREIAVARLEVRAGRPPHPLVFLERSNNIGWLDQMDPVWAEWEHWFLEIEETHTTHTSLPFFRSAHYGRSWLVAAGVVLDSAALLMSTIDVARSPRAALCIRSGFVALGNLADNFDVSHPVDPRPDDPVSIDRATFDRLCEQFEQRNIPLVADRDQAWRDFAGWRVNYDASLMGLLEYLRIEPGEWFGDHMVVPSNDASRPTR